MDVSEFTARVAPGKKVSKLAPFARQIGELRTKGYTLDQVREWLAQNGLEVSREAVRKFINRHGEAVASADSKGSLTAPPTSQQAPDAANPTALEHATNREPPAGELLPLVGDAAKARREQKADKFVGSSDKPKNPFIK
jgi:glutamyl/glutaminyl-tRNA synthetase